MKPLQKFDLRKHITSYRIANTIRGLRSTHRNHTFLILEGEDDEIVFKNFINPQECVIRIAHFKRVAVEAILELDKSRTRGVLAIVDADYERVNGNPKQSDNILFCDLHDLETMIILSPTFEKMLVDIAPELSATAIQELAEKVRTSLLDIGVPIGQLRWVNYRRDLFLDFKDLPYENFINATTLEVNMSILLQILNVGRNRPLDEDFIKQEIQQLPMENLNLWHICQGHESVKILRIVLPFHLSRITPPRRFIILQKQLRGKKFDDILLEQYESSFFLETDLYSEIRKWEINNTPFRVLSSTLMP